MILKIDNGGNLLWDKRFNSASDNHDRGYGIAFDSGGNVYVSGPTFITGNDYDIALLKFDTDGNLIWDYSYNSTSDLRDYSYSMYIDDENKIYISGYSNAANANIAALKLDSDGNIIWDKRFNASNNSNDYGFGIGLDEDGYIYISGYSYNGSNNDIPVLKLDSNGNIIWDKRFNSVNNNHDQSIGLVIDAGGSIVISGHSNNGSNQDFVAIRMKPNQTSSNIFTSDDPNFTKSDSGLTDNVPAYTSAELNLIIGDPNYTTSDPGYTGFQ
jgi:hypothetical protein